MANNDCGSIECRPEQPSLVVEQSFGNFSEQPPSTIEKSSLKSYDSDATLKTANCNERTIRFLNSWLWLMCFSYGERAECIDSISHKSETDQGPQEGYPVKPLRNLKNTCYLNAVIQCLNQTTEVHDKILDTRPKTYRFNNDHLSLVSVAQCGGPISQEMMGLFDQIETDRSIAPKLLLEKINEEENQFKVGTQQDSQEVLRYLLQKLKEEALQCIQDEIRRTGSSSLSDESMDELLKSAKKLTTPIEEVFGGMLVSTIICRECLTPLQLNEHFFDLQLSIPIRSQQQHKATGQSPSKAIPSKKTKDSSGWTFSRRRIRAVTPASDGGDIQPTESEQSGQYFSDGSHSSHKDTSSLSGIRAYSDGHQFVNPNDFISLQKYLHNTGKEFTSIDLKNVSAKNDLETSLKEYISIDILDENNKFNCDTCTARTLGSYAGSLVNRQVLIKQLPPILVLNIKRFALDSHTLRKNDDYLSFPHVLNMGPYCSEACFQELKDKNDHIMYGLYGVVVHNGSTLRGGHYVAYVKTRPKRKQTSSPTSDWEYDQRAAEGDMWYCTNDRHIKKCSKGFGSVCTKKAYLLFYELLPRS